MSDRALAEAWTRLMAPRTGNVRSELVQEAADFFGIHVDDAWQRLKGAGDRFRHEWIATVADARDESALIRFYNQSDTELFELLEWHAGDPIHYRALVVRDLALGRRGRSYLDYGSGIGSDALVFADAGFDVTLADVSDCLLAFAAWRCRRRGFAVSTIDLKRDAPPAAAFDVVVCFDVLEHIPKPRRVVRVIERAMRPDGLLVIHAPFADDPEHPMHVVHTDVVTPRMRSMGLQPVDWPFPPGVRAPQIFEKQSMRAIDRVGYFIYDGYLQNDLGARLASIYRRTFRRRTTLARSSNSVA
jgi:2-polyprenyl-3-methyl-5-hydroxy-6-metoxy-1,4-benzoquinol methylase